MKSLIISQQIFTFTKNEKTMKVIINMMAMAYRAIAAMNTLMIVGRRTKNTGSLLNLNIHTVRESHQTLALKPLKPTLNPLHPLQFGSVKQLQAVIVNTVNTTTGFESNPPQAVIVNTVNTTTGVESNPPRGHHHVITTERKLIFDMSRRQRVDNDEPATVCLAAVHNDPTTISSVNHLAPVVRPSGWYGLSDDEDDSSDDEADDVSTTISSVLAPVASVTRYCLSDDEDESASSDDDANDESKLFGEDVENDSLVYSVSDSDSIAVSDSDSIDVFLANESSDSDLDSVVKESSVIEMVDHHSCDKLIGTIVIVDDLMEDWKPEAEKDDASMDDVENWKPKAEKDDASMDDVENWKPEAEKDDASMDDVENWKPKAEKDDASMDDVENWKPKAEEEDASMDDVAVSDSDSIDVFLANESSDSDLDSVVKESSVIEMVDHHSCDKLIGTIVIVGDLAEVGSSGIVVNDHRRDDESMENVEDWKPEAEEEDASMEDAGANMDWEPLPLRRSPRLAALRDSSSFRPLRRSQRLAALYNGR
jgi:hypothetical protein